MRWDANEFVRHLQLTCAQLNRDKSDFKKRLTAFPKATQKEVEHRDVVVAPIKSQHHQGKGKLKQRVKAMPVGKVPNSQPPPKTPKKFATVPVGSEVIATTFKMRRCSMLP